MAKACLVIMYFCGLFGFQTQPEQTADTAQARFVPLHIYLDSGREPLAAYQFELKTVSGQVKIVGVEGGDVPAFNDPPYYDPAALANDRIIIAAFNADESLPTGKTRIATIHLMITGQGIPEYDIQLTTAANPDGRRIEAEITYEQGDIQ